MRRFERGQQIFAESNFFWHSENLIQVSNQFVQMFQQHYVVSQVRYFLILAIIPPTLFIGVTFFCKLLTQCNQHIINQLKVYFTRF